MNEPNGGCSSGVPSGPFERANLEAYIEQAHRQAADWIRDHPLTDGDAE